MIDWTEAQRIAREVRQAIGIERTPEQIQEWMHNNVRRPKNLVKSALSDPDIMLDLANRMRIPYLDNTPPSSELLS